MGDADTLPRIYTFETVDSTQEEVRRLVKNGTITETAVVVATHQTQGKGTQGRVWVSPEGVGLYFSIVHCAQPARTFAATNVYTQAAGVACVEALAEVCGVSIQLKPVNDLYAQGKKLGGILVESELNQTGITTLITGIGMNVNQVTLEVPGGVMPISLQALLTDEDFQALDRTALLETVVARICFWYGHVFQGQHQRVCEKWETYCL